MNERQEAERFAELLSGAAGERAAGHRGGSGAQGAGSAWHGGGGRHGFHGGRERETGAGPNGAAYGRPGNGGQSAASEAGSLGHLVAVAERVTEVGRGLPAPSADFRAALRARLVEAAPRLIAEADAAAAAAATGVGAAALGTAATQADEDASGAAGEITGVNGSGSTGAGKSRSRLRVPTQRRGRSGARHSAEGKTSVFTGISAAWRRRLLAAGVGVAVATGSVGGIAIASAGAVPGDPLYNAKKVFENLQLSLSGSPTDQGREYLRLADTRLGEIDALLARPDVDMTGSPTQAYLGQTLGDLRTMIGDGGSLLIGQVQADGDQTALHALADFLLTERQRVADLSWRLPPSLQSQPPQVVALMDQLSSRLQQAAAAAAQAEQGGQNPNVLESPGTPGDVGGQGAPTGAGGQTGPYPSAPGSTARTSSAPAPTGRPSSEGSPSSGATGTPTPGPSGTPSANPTIGLNIPVNGLPSIGISIPPILGLPGIDLGLGGDGDTPGAAPTQ